MTIKCHLSLKRSAPMAVEMAVYEFIKHVKKKCAFEEMADTFFKEQCGRRIAAEHLSRDGFKTVGATANKR